MGDYETAAEHLEEMLLELAEISAFNIDKLHIILHISADTQHHVERMIGNAFEWSHRYVWDSAGEIKRP